MGWRFFIVSGRGSGDERSGAAWATEKWRVGPGLVGATEKWRVGPGLVGGIKKAAHREVNRFV